jgi:hypothetical protein
MEDGDFALLAMGGMLTLLGKEEYGLSKGW